MREDIKKVLIVDNREFFRNTVKNLFIQLGYEIAGEASSQIEAVEKYQSLSPDYVTINITMPQLGGIEAIKKIRKIDDDSNIIVISAIAQKNIILEAIDAGAKSFMLKPVTASRVKKVISEIEAYNF